MDGGGAFRARRAAGRGDTGAVEGGGGSAPVRGQGQAVQVDPRVPPGPGPQDVGPGLQGQRGAVAGPHRHRHPGDVARVGAGRGGRHEQRDRVSVHLEQVGPARGRKRRRGGDVQSRYARLGHRGGEDLSRAAEVVDGPDLAHGLDHQADAASGDSGEAQGDRGGGLARAAVGDRGNVEGGRGATVRLEAQAGGDRVTAVGHHRQVQVVEGQRRGGRRLQPGLSGRVLDGRRPRRPRVAVEAGLGPGPEVAPDAAGGGRHGRALGRAGLAGAGVQGRVGGGVGQSGRARQREGAGRGQGEGAPHGRLLVPLVGLSRVGPGPGQQHDQAMVERRPRQPAQGPGR